MKTFSKTAIEKLIISETHKYHIRLPKIKREEIYNKISLAIQDIISGIVKNYLIERAKG